MAIHTGEASGDYRGSVVNRCARLRALGHGGQILISSTAASLLGGRLPEGAWLIDLGMHRLRDFTGSERVYQLCHPQLLCDFPALASLDQVQQNLPLQLTSFIGREREVAEVKELLRAHRLVTLVGAGGCGKTRLALKVAAEIVPTYHDGVWFANLAPLADPGLVPQVVAKALRLREQPDRALPETIADDLRSKELLLLLDNCEHLAGPCSELVERFLKEAPRINVLATSREALRIPGELAWTVPTLSLPPERQSEGLEDLYRYESVRLFVDRAVASQPAFSLSRENASAVSLICRRLDGMPLAIELAAARLRLTAPALILERIEDRFKLLTDGGRTVPERQKTLRAAMDWSHELLESPERTLFRWVAVFAGGFDLPAAEHVCDEPLGDREVLDVLTRLVDKSLVLAELLPDGSVRYRQLETLREYGRQKLLEAGDEPVARDAHLRYYTSVAERAYRERVDHPTEWLARLERDHDNLRAALEWSRRRGPGGEHLRLAGALAWFWYAHAHRIEGGGRLDDALTGAAGTSPLVARAIAGAGTLAVWQGDLEQALRLGEQSVQMWRDLGDEAEVVLALGSLGQSHFIDGDEERALSVWQESLRFANALGDRRLINRARLSLCQVLVARNDVDAAEPIAQAGLVEGQELNDASAVGSARHYLGDCALIREDFRASERRYADAVRGADAMGAVTQVCRELQGVSMAVAGQGRYLKALRLDAAAAATFAELGANPRGLHLSFWDALRARYIGKAAQEVGDEAATAARQEGQTMGLRAAIDYGLDFGLD